MSTPFIEAMPVPLNAAGEFDCHAIVKYEKNNLLT
jgi:hypothetical protein